jgi:hypothetical protein
MSTQSTHNFLNFHVRQTKIVKLVPYERDQDFIQPVSIRPRRPADIGGNFEDQAVLMHEGLEGFPRARGVDLLRSFVQRGDVFTR